MEAGLTAIEWQNFYLLLGGATATFAGLLFVALSLNSKSIHQKHNTHFKSLAMLTFQNFQNILLISLVMEVPGFPMIGMGWELIIIAVVGLTYSVRTIIKARTELRNDTHKRAVIRGFRVSIIAYFGLAATGWMFCTKSPAAYKILIGPAAGLLLTGARNAWLLLLLLNERESTAPEHSA